MLEFNLPNNPICLLSRAILEQLWTAEEEFANNLAERTDRFNEWTNNRLARRDAPKNVPARKILSHDES